MSHHPKISEISTGFDCFLSGIMARPVTASLVSEEARAMGADAVTDRYVDVCLKTHTAVSVTTPLSVGSLVSAFA